MLKRFLLLAGLISFASPAFAAGTIPFSLSQQFDSLGHVLAGCQFYTIQAGTTSTPQSAYQDSALTIALPNPQTCDAAGRLPQMFLADGTIKVRLTDRNGVTQVVADNIQVIGASSGGGGGGGTVDPTTILATGDFKQVYNTGVLTGFVRCNGRTIGSATSGATERANADTSALFAFLWNADSNLAVSGGRGASAAADYAANKTIALPDCRGRAFAGLADMGNSATTALTSTYANCTPTTLGAACGSQSHTQTTAEMPSHTHTATVTDPGHSHLVAVGGAGTSTPGAFPPAPGTARAGSGSSDTATTGITVSNSSTGSGNAFSVVNPMILATVYIKL